MLGIVDLVAVAGRGGSYGFHTSLWTHIDGVECELLYIARGGGGEGRRKKATAHHSGASGTKLRHKSQQSHSSHVTNDESLINCHLVHCNSIDEVE